MCGIIGIFGKENITMDLYNGLRALQHRGQSSAGFITYDGNIYPKKDYGFVDNLTFGYRNENRLAEDHPGPIGIGHTRYSTIGSDTKEALKKNAQPEYLINPFIASCHNGNIINGKEVLETVHKKPRTECDIQYLLLPMAQELPPFPQIKFDNLIESGERVMNLAKGSYSVLFMTASRKRPYLIAMTDPHKIRPMVMGQKDDTWYISSESAVLSRLGVKDFKDVEGGTIISFNPDNPDPKQERLVKKKKNCCMFEFVYFANPQSWIEGKSVHSARVAIGEELGRKTAPEDADIVVPVPESGRRYAIGFSRSSGIPLEEGLKKDKNHRVFILQTQDKREKKIKDNLIAIDAALDGKSVVLTDDSLVRGTNIKRVIQKVRDAGARKVHVRIGCPPLVAPCYLGIDMRSKKEFIALKEDGELRTEEEIAELIGADSLAYANLDTIRKAIGLNSDDQGLCTGCINYPNGYPDDMQEDVKKMYEMDKDSSCRAYEVDLGY